MSIDLNRVGIIISDYEMDYNMPALTFANRSVFERYSVIRWACDALWDYILICSRECVEFSDIYLEDLSQIIADFRHEIHSCMEASKRTEKIFLIALDVIDDIEDLLCGIAVNTAKEEFEKENDYGFI